MARGRDEKAMFIADCPRCGHKRTTFDITASAWAGRPDYRNRYECTLLCRSCAKPSIALLWAKDGSESASPMSEIGEYANRTFSFVEWVFNIPGTRETPAFVPEQIAAIFQEGAVCLALGLWDAAGSMFRKVLDAATRDQTPTPDSGIDPAPPSWKTYKDLRLRLDWLFENGKLNRSLEELSSCIHQDGNDAVHDLAGIGKDEAEDLADFTDQILQIIYTFPGQIEANKQRRDDRRSSQ